MNLIVNADDYGFSKGVNYGIIEAHKNGIVTSTTLMVNMPEVGHALELSAENPNLGVGIHLVLDCGKPTGPSFATLVDENKHFLSFSQIVQMGDPEEIEYEFISQIEKFISFGIFPTHIDGHHHIHSHEKIAAITLKVANQYKIPVRKSFDAKDPFETTAIFENGFYGEEAIDFHNLTRLLNKYDENSAVELMCHPAFLDQELLTRSSYNRERMKELAVLTSTSVKQWVEDRGIKLVNYGNLNDSPLVTHLVS